MDNMNTAELSLDILDQISGGVIDKSQRQVIVKMMIAFKGGGATKEATIGMLTRSCLPGTTLEGVTGDEIEEVVDKYWDRY